MVITPKTTKYTTKKEFLKYLYIPSAAASTCWMGSSIIADHNTSLLKVTELFFQVSTKSLKNTPWIQRVHYMF